MSLYMYMYMYIYVDAVFSRGSPMSSPMSGPTKGPLVRDCCFQTIKKTQATPKKRHK